MLIKPTPKTFCVDEPKKCNRRDAPKAIVDLDDIFDVHSYDYLEEEFGTLSRPKTTIEEEEVVNKETVPNNENFNFVEACQTLKEDITGNVKDEESDSEPRYDAVNLSDIRRAKVNVGDLTAEISNLDISAGEETISVSENDGPNLDDLADSVSTENTFVESEDAAVGGNTERPANETKNGKVYLASGSQESFVIIWDTETGSVSQRIQLKTHGKMAVPSE